MDKAYNRINWQNQPNTSTALGATNLNKMDVAINTIDDRVIALDTVKAPLNTVNAMVKSITYNQTSGVFTVTYQNGTVSTYDTKLEKLAVNFAYDQATERLVITLDDGSEQYVDLSSLITQYEFENSSTVGFTVTGGKVKAEVPNGSITAEKLQPDYLADVTVQAQTATTQATLSKRYAVGGVEEGDASDNARYYKEEAKRYRDEAQAIVGIDIATDTQAGIVKGGSNVNIAPDGTMSVDEIEAENVSYDSTVSGLDATNTQEAIDEIIAQKGQAEGIATLGVDKKIPSSQLPQMTVNSYIDVKNPPAPMIAAVGNGVADDTLAITNILSALSGRTVMFSHGTYLIQRIAFPNYSNILFDNCKLIRALGYGGDFIMTGQYTMMSGILEIDGRKDLYTIETVAMSGLYMQPHSKFFGHVISNNNVTHGIKMDSYTYLQSGYCSNNGIYHTPAGDSKGDGLFVLNAFDVVVDNIETTANSRIGVTVTTYDTGTGGVNALLTDNVLIHNIKSYANRYVDTDIEGSRNTIIKRLTGWGTLSASFSERCIFENVEIKSFYAQDHHLCRAANFKIKPSGAVSNVFYLKGNSPYVDGVYIYDTATSYVASNTFEVSDGVKYNAVVKNVTVEKGYNGLVVGGCNILENCKTLAATNIPMSIGGRTIPILLNLNHEKLYVRGGLATIYFDYWPGSGYGLDAGSYRKGDTVIKNTPTAGTSYGWVCITDGTPGAWKGFGALAT